MRLAAVIVCLGALIFIAHLLAAAFARTRIPDVLGLLLIGVALGPVTHRLTPASLGMVGPTFTAVTLVLILFESGLSLQFSRLRRALPGTLKLANSVFIAAALLVGLTAWALTPLGAGLAFLLGVMVAGNSPTVIVPLAKGLGLEARTADILFLESAFGDVISIVLALALIDFHFHGLAHWVGAAAHFVLGFGAALLIGFVGALLWSRALRTARALQNPMFTTPAFVFLIYGGSELLRANGAMAALAFGVVLGNLELLPLLRTHAPEGGLNEPEKVFLAEIVFMLKTFFFVYIGISVQFTHPRWLAFGALLSLVLLAARIPAARWALGAAMPARDAALAACMVPKGLAAAVLAELILQRHVPGGEMIESVTYAVIFFSVVLASLLVFAVDRPLGRRAMLRLLGRAPVPAVPAA